MLADSILWPLFHYHPGEITFDESAWAAYQEVNRLFAKTVIKDVQDGDLIWVHDYHLMLLPQMLREEIGESKKNVKIGFFSPSTKFSGSIPMGKAPTVTKRPFQSTPLGVVGHSRMREQLLRK